MGRRGVRCEVPGRALPPPGAGPTGTMPGPDPSAPLSWHGTHSYGTGDGHGFCWVRKRIMGAGERGGPSCALLGLCLLAIWWMGCGSGCRGFDAHATRSTSGPPQRSPAHLARCTLARLRTVRESLLLTDRGAPQSCWGQTLVLQNRAIDDDVSTSATHCCALRRAVRGCCPWRCTRPLRRLPRASSQRLTGRLAGLVRLQQLDFPLHLGPSLMDEQPNDRWKHRGLT